VWWVWFGSAVMVFGTMLTLLPDRKTAPLAPERLLLDTRFLEESLKPTK